MADGIEFVKPRTLAWRCRKGHGATVDFTAENEAERALAFAFAAEPDTVGYIAPCPIEGCDATAVAREPRKPKPQKNFRAALEKASCEAPLPPLRPRDDHAS